MFLLSVSEKFDSAHQLTHYNGNCRNLHGHTWKVKATWEFDEQVEEGSYTGMCCDFQILKSRLFFVTKGLDHHFINDYIYPTAENIAKHIFSMLQLPNPAGGKLKSVTVWETEDSEVVYEGL